MTLDPWAFKLTRIGNRGRWQAENETGDTIFTVTALTRRGAWERVTEHVPWATRSNPPLAALRNAVTGTIARGDASPITEVTA